MLVREMILDDIYRGFSETLSVLASVSLSAECLADCFAIRKRQGIVTLVAIEENRGMVVGTVSIVMENKFIHGHSCVAHIEDLAVMEEYQKIGVGQMLMEHAAAEARNAACYKAILNCNAATAGFYEKIGYKKHEQGMRLDI